MNTWIVEPEKTKAHLDIGERVRLSLRDSSEHLILTACWEKVLLQARIVLDTHKPKCPNCQRYDAGQPMLIEDVLLERFST